MGTIGRARGQLRLLHVWVVTCFLLSPNMFVSGRHREGGTPVPVEVIREARALNARYRHVTAQHRQRRRRLQKTIQGSQSSTNGTQPRQGRIRGLQQQQQQQQQAESFLFDALVDHLFVPPQAEADNEQEISTSDSTTTSLRQVALEGSAKPLFFCSSCRNEDMEECAQCTQQIDDQQGHIISAVKELFPEAKIVTTTSKLIK